MSNENIKLAKIKKSCHVASMITKIMFVLCIVGTVIAIGTGIYFIADRKNLNDAYEQAAEVGSMDITKEFGKINVHLVRINYNDVISPEALKNVDSSIPAVKEVLNETPYSLSIGLYLMIIGGSIFLLTVAMFLLNRVFKIIEKEETPFSDKVLKNLLVSLLIIDVIIAMSAGIGFGALAGLITWALYTIMDYGRTLQIQSDETL